MASNYYFNIKQQLNDPPHHHSQSPPPFLRHFHLKLDFRYISQQNPNTTLVMFRRQIECSRTLIFSDHSGPKALHTLFSDTGSPDEFVESVVSDLIDFAEGIDSDPINAGREVLRIEIQVLVRVPHEEEEEVMEEQVGFMAASKSSIEGLERVKLGEIDVALPLKKRRRRVLGWNDEECAICLEEFRFRSEAEEVVRMPCGHFFHESCVVRWLEKSHLCPLCRYSMPC